MSNKFRRVLSTMLTGFLGGVIALVVLALLTLGPLRALGARLNPFAETLPPCLMTPVVAETCLGNERQLSGALSQYQQDYDQTYPSGTQPEQTSSGTVNTGVGWAGQIYPYFRNAAVFQCPFDTTIAMKPDCVVSYALNTSIQGFPYGRVMSPSQSLVLFEVGGDFARIRSLDEGASMGATLFSAAGDGTDGNLAAGPRSAVASSVYYATGDMGERPTLDSDSQFRSATPRDDPYETNIIFIDGHVKSCVPSQISTGTNAPTPYAPPTGTVHGSAAGTAYASSNGDIATFSLE